ncbi:hypothetical protein STAQ_33580 [Allostella sp. ATCC 35155]|nr:hypothetical protein STAQ_33580 [Stella sp. ATCC 35155]
MIAAGRPPVRTARFMTALVAVRFNPTIRTFHQRLIAAGKPEMVAIIAAARKLLTILSAILCGRTPWQAA